MLWGHVHMTQRAYPCHQVAALTVSARHTYTTVAADTTASSASTLQQPRHIVVTLTALYHLIFTSFTLSPFEFSPSRCGSCNPNVQDASPQRLPSAHLTTLSFAISLGLYTALEISSPYPSSVTPHEELTLTLIPLPPQSLSPTVLAGQGAFPTTAAYLLLCVSSSSSDVDFVNLYSSAVVFLKLLFSFFLSSTFSKYGTLGWLSPPCHSLVSLLQ